MVAGLGEGRVADGFSVDLDTLENAGRGVASLMIELNEHRIADLRCEPAAVGHDRLAGSLSSFCQRWQIGVANLSQDGDHLATSLTRSARRYRETEDEIVASLTKVTGEH
jgi:hypothetical protein